VRVSDTGKIRAQIDAATTPHDVDATAMPPPIRLALFDTERYFAAHNDIVDVDKIFIYHWRRHAYAARKIFMIRR